MAKLTARTELAATPADGDLVHIVDVSDTTDNAAGTSKKITRVNLVGGLQAEPSEGAFVDGDKTKLDGIETAADVTDTVNVTAAGALMDSELTDLAGVKGVTISTLQVKPAEGAFVDGDKTKLDGIETAADVTDATNVASAGAVMADGTGNDITGDMVFTEKADHTSTPIATKGYLWVKSDAPSTLQFTDDAGTDWTLNQAAGGGGNPYGADFVVAASGGDYTSVGAALAAVADSSVIYVEPGTYTETTTTMTCNNATVIGDHHDLVILDGTTSAIKTIDGSGNHFRGIRFNNSSTGRWRFTGTETTFENCMFRAGVANLYQFFIDSDRFRINQCYFTNSTGAGRQFYVKGPGGTLTNSVFYVDGSDEETYGLVQLDDDIAFTGNYVQVYGSASNHWFMSLSQRNAITGNVFYMNNNTATAIAASGDSNTISGNTIRNGRQGIYLNAASNAVSGNRFVDITTTGVYVASGNENMITGNNIGGSSGTTGVYLNGGDYPVITGNVFTGTWTTGVNVSAAAIDKAVVVGNGLVTPTTGLSDSGTGTVSGNNAT